MAWYGVCTAHRIKPLICYSKIIVLKLSVHSRTCKQSVSCFVDAHRFTSFAPPPPSPPSHLSAITFEYTMLWRIASPQKSYKLSGRFWVNNQARIHRMIYALFSSTYTIRLPAVSRHETNGEKKKIDSFFILGFFFDYLHTTCAQFRISPFIIIIQVERLQPSLSPSPFAVAATLTHLVIEYFCR